MNDDLVIINEHRPNRADALRNRALLLETAQRLFEEQGVEAVSMSSIAEAAGVGKGTLYRHFTSKSELGFALLDADQRDLQERTFARLRGNAGALENLRWFAGEALAFIECHRSLLRAAQGEGMNNLEHPAHLWWRQTIRSLLEQLGMEGDVDYMSDILYVMLNTQTYDFQRRVLGYDVERIRQGILVTLDHLLAGSEGAKKD